MHRTMRTFYLCRLIEGVTWTMLGAMEMRELHWVWTDSEKN